MAVKMRLMRMGKTKSPHYRVVVIDGRAPRDGRYIDLIGRYDPREEPSVIEIDETKAVDWLRKGAQPTEAVQKILDAAGALTQFKVKSGQIHTVGGDDRAAAGQPAETIPPEETAPAPEAPAGEEAPTGAESEEEKSPSEDSEGAEPADSSEEE